MLRCYAPLIQNLALNVTDVWRLCRLPIIHIFGCFILALIVNSLRRLPTPKPLEGEHIFG